ncbi:MAG: hypothetical protein IPJ98_00750 [Bryobacterales bacterium]|nr:hypothetical protein [Bryobacterales bacterium]
MHEALFVAAILAAIALWGALLWLGVRAVFARLSGWNRLAVRYPVTNPAPAWTWRGQTIQVGPVRYRNCVSAAATHACLHLRSPALFGFPALSIPWAELHSPAQVRVYRRDAIRLQAGRPPVGAISLPRELYDQIRYAPRLS